MARKVFFTVLSKVQCFLTLKTYFHRRLISSIREAFLYFHNPVTGSGKLGKENGACSHLCAFLISFCL